MQVWIVSEDSPNMTTLIVVAASAERALALARADSPYAIGRWSVEAVDTLREGVVTGYSR